MKNISKLQFITYGDDKPTILNQVKQVCEGECDWIQLRLKDIPKSTLLEIAKEVKGICRFYGARLIINDYVELAKEINANGVHLGKNDTSVSVAKKNLGAKYIIGGTANTFEDIKKLVVEGVDYIGLGPYKFTATKKNLSPVLGTEGYQNIWNEMQKQAIDIPLVAIGSILTNDIATLKAIGINNFAVSSGIAGAKNIQKLTKEYLKLVN